MVETHAALLTFVHNYYSLILERLFKALAKVHTRQKQLSYTINESKYEGGKNKFVDFCVDLPLTRILRLLHLLLVYLNDSLAIIIDVTFWKIFVFMCCWCLTYMMNTHVTTYGNYRNGRIQYDKNWI